MLNFGSNSVELACLKVKLINPVNPRSYSSDVKDVSGYVSGDWLIPYDDYQDRYYLYAHRVVSSHSFYNFYDFYNWTGITEQEMKQFLADNKVPSSRFPKERPDNQELRFRSRKENYLDIKYPIICYAKKLERSGRVGLASDCLIGYKLIQNIENSLKCLNYINLIPHRIKIAKNLVNDINKIYGVVFSPFDLKNYMNNHMNKTYFQYFTDNDMTNIIHRAKKFGSNLSRYDCLYVYISHGARLSKRLPNISKVKHVKDNLIRSLKDYLKSISGLLSNRNILIKVERQCIKLANDHIYYVCKHLDSFYYDSPITNLRHFTRKDVLNYLGHGLYPISIFKWKGLSHKGLFKYLKSHYIMTANYQLAPKYMNTYKYSIYSQDLGQYVYTPMFFNYLDKILRNKKTAQK